MSVESDGQPRSPSQRVSQVLLQNGLKCLAQVSCVPHQFKFYTNFKYCTPSQVPGIAPVFPPVYRFPSPKNLPVLKVLGFIRFLGTSGPFHQGQGYRETLSRFQHKQKQSSFRVQVHKSIGSSTSPILQSAKEVIECFSGILDSTWYLYWILVFEWIGWHLEHQLECVFGLLGTSHFPVAIYQRSANSSSLSSIPYFLRDCLVCLSIPGISAVSVRKSLRIHPALSSPSRSRSSRV